MKITTISHIGYNAPSQANWCYNIYKIDLIDTEKNYCISLLTKENFGGDSRLKNILKEKYNLELIQTQSVYTSTGTQKITGIQKLPETDSDIIIKEIVEHLTGKSITI